MVEMALCMFVFVVFIYACIEMVFLIQDKIYVAKIVREGAREAGITDSIDAGYLKAEDCAKQYLGSTSRIEIDMVTTETDGNVRNVVCTAILKHRVFEKITGQTAGRMVELNEKAIYPIWDQNT